MSKESTRRLFTGIRNQQQRTSPHCIGPNKLRRCVATQQVARQKNMQRIEGLVYVIHCQKTTLTCGEDRGRSRSYAHSRFKRCGFTSIVLAHLLLVYCSPHVQTLSNGRGFFLINQLCAGSGKSYCTHYGRRVISEWPKHSPNDYLHSVKELPSIVLSTRLKTNIVIGLFTECFIYRTLGKQGAVSVTMIKSLLSVWIYGTRQSRSMCRVLRKLTFMMY